ncbi:unannotated protein [freshwater metagenome]|uniref:Unannotated protein n=1 Tax=freshwater metagenome TaxID=449393 RepID=A0A6J6K4A6_9ZZZZ
MVVEAIISDAAAKDISSGMIVIPTEILKRNCGFTFALDAFWVRSLALTSKLDSWPML